MRRTGSATRVRWHYATTLIFVQGVIALVGLHQSVGRRWRARHDREHPPTRSCPGRPDRCSPRPSGQARQAGSSHPLAADPRNARRRSSRAPTLMGQIERALNRIYGVERDRPTLQKYGRAVVLTLSAGVLPWSPSIALALGRDIGSSIGSSAVATVWDLVRWPLALRPARGRRRRCCSGGRPRRHQPALVLAGVRRGRVRRTSCSLTAGLDLFVRSELDVRGDLRAARRASSRCCSGRSRRRSRSSSGRRSPRSSRPSAPALPSRADRDAPPSRRIADGARRAAGDRRRARDLERRRRPSDRAPTRLRRTLEGIIGVPMTEGNSVEVLRNGDAIFPAMLEAIERRRAHDRFPDVRLLAGRRRHAVRRGARRSGRAPACASALLLDGWGAPSDRPRAGRP